jgi:hypothetical protein
MESSPTISQDSDFNDNILPIHPSNHPLNTNISSTDILAIQQVYCHSAHQQAPLTNLNSSYRTKITLHSFRELIDYNSPMNDTIIHDFLSILTST